MYQCNYNKKTTNYKNNIFAKMIFNLLPNKLLVSKTKETLKNGYVNNFKQKTLETLTENEYLYFNMFTYNFLILDIDHKKNGINDIINILDDNFIQKPNWIIETNGGYQVGFILEKPFLVYQPKMSKMDKKLESYAKYLQKKMLFLLDGDLNTNRTKGWWKNPAGMDFNKFRSFYNVNNVFNLSDFDIYLPSFDGFNETNKNNGNSGGDFHKNKNLIKKLIEQLILKGNLDILKNVKEGIRNGFLWYLGMYLIKHNKNEWEHKLDFYNNNIKKPLGDTEMENIKKSVKKYTKTNKNFVGLGSYENWTKELKNLYMNKYRKQKGIIKNTNEEIKEINKNKVIQAIYKIIENKEKLTNKNISKYSGLGLTTVKTYKKQLLELEHFRSIFNKK